MAIDRRQLIVDAASKSFALFGYKATTMDQIARIANVGKGTIYTFFANKEELFKEIMSLLILEMKNMAEEAVDPEHRFFESLNRVMDRMLDFREEHELAIKLSQEMRACSTGMANEGIQQIEKAIVGYIQVQVQSALDKGEIKHCNPELTAFVLMKLYIALTVDWKKSHEPLDKRQAGELLRIYLQKGLAPN